MPRASEAVWAEERRRLVEAIESDRLSCRDAMDALGVSAATVAGWVSAERRRRRRVAIARPPFVAIDVREDAGVLGAVAVVEVGDGIRVRVERGFDAAEVLRLVRALVSPC